MADKKPKQPPPSPRAPRGRGSGNGSGSHPPHHHHKRIRVYDTTDYRLECAKRPGTVFTSPSSRPYDGYINAVSWNIEKGVCGNGKMAIHLFIGDQDQGPLLVVDKDTPMHGCIHPGPFDFHCGDGIKLVAMAVTDFEFCSPCGVTVSLAHCKAYRKPPRPKCPEILEAWNSGEQTIPESPVVGNPNYIVANLDTKRALPPTPHISEHGGGVFGLKHGLYEIGYQIAGRSPQSTDVIFGGDLQFSLDGGATWSIYPASESDARFHYGAVGGKVSNSRGTMTYYIPCDGQVPTHLIRVVLWRSKDSTEVDTLIQGNAIRISRWCDCPRNKCDDDDGYGHGEG